MKIVYTIIALAILAALGFLFFSPNAATEGMSNQEQGMMEEEGAMEEGGDSMMEGGSEENAMDQGEEETAGSNGDSMEQGATITYTNEGFSPANVSISAGDTVTFVNESDREVWPASAIHPTHSVYSGTNRSEHCQNPDGNAFDACGGVAPGESWSFTFQRAGEWGYHDHLRANYTGMVTVE